jgi:RHS repeat-associated protein
MPSYLYDPNGNMKTDGTRSFTWTSFDMPLVISKSATSGSPGSGSASFNYGADHQRVRQVWSQGSSQITTVYLDDFDMEKVTDSTGSTYKHFVKVDGRIVATVVRAPSGNSVMYLLPDHLGSTAVVTDASGAVVDRMAYDPWGDRRFASGSSIGASDSTNSIQPSTTDRGFTGHEMLDEGNLGLVHMNGRVYDPTLGRFISADPTIQDPQATQSFNRFSYVSNAPLDATDPSGYKTDWIIAAINSRSNLSLLDEDNTFNYASSYYHHDTFEDALVKAFAADTERSQAIHNQEPWVNVSDAARYETWPRVNVTSHQEQRQDYLDDAVTLLEYAPVTGELIGIFDGVKRNDWLGVGFNVVALGLDVGSFGGTGAALTGVRVAARGARAYSVAFETTIAKLGLGTRREHFKAANAALESAIKSDPSFARMAEGLNIQVPLDRRTSPSGWTWHHAADEPGVMQLVPRDQHLPGSAWQPLLHPDRKGGFSNWGADY